MAYADTIAQLATIVAGASPDPTNQADPERKEIERLRSEHPDYQARKGAWAFFLKSYEGGESYISEETLFSHVRENDDDFRDRLKRAHYQNYCQPLTDFVPDFIYGSDIERQATGAALKSNFDAFKNNVNRAGLSLTEFMRELAEDIRIFGHMFVQVDKPALPSALGTGTVTVSAAQARRLQLEPYFIKICPLEVLDWVTDAKGNYVYLKRKECYDELVARSRTPIERYTEWYTDEYTITRLDVSDTAKPRILDVNTYPNTLKELPFVKVIYKHAKSNRDISLSFLEDIASQNRSVFNLTSLIDEFLYRQCFNVLAMPSSTQVATRDTVEGVIGSSNILEFPNEAKHAPGYLSPPVEPAAFIQAERQAVVEEMYRTAAQDIASELMAGSNRSGDASRQAFGRQVPVIARQADTLQEAERRLLSMWAKLQGKEWTGKIAYKDDYSVTSMMDLILQFTSIFNSARILSPTFVREEWKRLVREYDGKIPQDKMEKIVREIDAVPDQKIVDLITQPANTEATQGVPSTANMLQGRQQAGQSDKQRSLRTGDRSATKEGNRDRNKQTKRAA